MRTSRKLAVVLLMLAGCACLGEPVSAQTATSATPRPTQAPSSPTAKKQSATVGTTRQSKVETATSAPQVLTLLHRLSGLQMFRLLLRSGDVGAIARLDESFTINGEVHTNVIAGLALDDGETVAAWLPEAGAELVPPMPAQPTPKTEPVAPVAPLAPEASASRLYRSLPGSMLEMWSESPNLTVVARDRRRLIAHYIGLDGVTGLSVLRLASNSLPRPWAIAYANEAVVRVGQRVHLVGPEPVAENESGPANRVYVRLGATEGQITNVVRAPSGAVARFEMKSPKLSPANIGGIALTEAGETLGIIDSVKGTDASILPATIIRGAAKRVLQRQASVPRPWLGVSGEPLGAFTLEPMLRAGWESQMARSLAEERRGILLTSITPNSPASTAQLRPGDVILRVNDDEVRSADDFSWFISNAGPGALLKFTIARPGNTALEAVEVKLKESPDPFFGFRTQLPSTLAPAAFPGLPSVSSQRLAATYSLLKNQIETIAIRPRPASRLGSNGGLLVVYVEPATAAFKAGFRPGDVIEQINGQTVSSNAEANKLTDGTAESYSFSIIRNKQKLVLKVDQ